MDLNQVTLASSNIEKSIEFYEKLGLILIVKSLPKYARFECPDGNSTLSIHKVKNLPSGDGNVIYFENEKIDAKVEELKKSGITFDLLPKDQSWLWREAHLRDPDNNRIIIFWAGENRKYPPWRIFPKEN